MEHNVCPMSGVVSDRYCRTQGMDCLDAEMAEVPIHARRPVPGGMADGDPFRALRNFGAAKAVMVLGECAGALLRIDNQLWAWSSELEQGNDLKEAFSLL